MPAANAWGVAWPVTAFRIERQQGPTKCNPTRWTDNFLQFYLHGDAERADPTYFYVAVCTSRQKAKVTWHVILKHSATCNIPKDASTHLKNLLTFRSVAAYSHHNWHYSHVTIFMNGRTENGIGYTWRYQQPPCHHDCVISMSNNACHQPLFAWPFFSVRPADYSNARSPESPTNIFPSHEHVLIREVN